VEAGDRPDGDGHERERLVETIIEALEGRDGGMNPERRGMTSSPCLNTLPA
jgi:hypothetical protein